MSTLKVNSIIPVSGVPTGGGGGIVQIKTATKTDHFTSTASSFVDITGLSVDMALTKSGHKIFITYNVISGGNWWQTGPSQIRLVQDSTNIGLSTSASGTASTTFANLYSDGASNSNYNICPQSANLLFSPSDTNSHTYKLQIKGSNTNGVSINRWWANPNAGGISTLTLMEVSA